MWIKGGKWIVYHFGGAIMDIFETLQGIFSVWMYVFRFNEGKNSEDGGRICMLL